MLGHASFWVRVRVCVRVCAALANPCLASRSVFSMFGKSPLPADSADFTMAPARKRNGAEQEHFVLHSFVLGPLLAMIRCA